MIFSFFSFFGIGIKRRVEDEDVGIDENVNLLFFNLKWLVVNFLLE